MRICGVSLMTYLIVIVCLLISYLYGSIPFALVIGKVFYNTDVRQYGSHNLGGTNAGRVLGKKAGAAVILLDATKCIITILLTGWIAHLAGITHDIIYPCALFCMIGHCYPIFASFKGGKAVSSAIAYTLMTNIYGFFIACIVFLITLKSTKYVSLSSILGALAVLIASPFIGYSKVGMITNVLIVILIIYRHRANIQRIKEGTENKVKWF